MRKPPYPKKCIKCNTRVPTRELYVGEAGIGIQCCQCGSVFHSRYIASGNLKKGFYWTDEKMEFITDV